MDALEERALYDIYCDLCARTIAQGDLLQHDGDYCPDCYRQWAESFRPWLRLCWANPKYTEVAPELIDGMDGLAFAETEPPYRNAVDDLELLGRGVEALAEVAFTLVREAHEMNEQLSGCDWCCGGGDERMVEIADAFRHINEQAKEIGR